MQRRKATQWGLGAAIVVFLGLGALLLFGRIEIPFSEEKLQSIVAAKIPIEKSGVKVNSANVNVGEKDVAIAFAMEGNRLGQKFQLAASARGVPEYRHSGGEFFFRPSEVQVLQFAYDKDGKIGNMMRSVTNTFIKDESRRAAMLKAVPVLESWVKSWVESGAVMALEKIPVYRLKNDVKGWVAWSALESVKVKNGQVVVAISFAAFTWHVIVLCICVIVAIGFLFAIAQSPGWGTVALIGLSIGGD